MTISATPPSLIDGLRPIDRSFESWWVRPGSATAVELHAGDRVTVIDPDGGQPAELTRCARTSLGIRLRTLRQRFCGVWASEGFLRLGAFERAPAG